MTSAEANDGVALTSMAHPRPVWWKRPYWWLRTIMPPRIRESALENITIKITEPSEPARLILQLVEPVTFAATMREYPLVMGTPAYVDGEAFEKIVWPRFIPGTKYRVILEIER